MKNIIIAGDSFCASLGWPEQLASELANLIINYKEGPGQLSIEKFDLITSKWFDWQHTEDKDMWRIAEW